MEVIYSGFDQVCDSRDQSTAVGTGEAWSGGGLLKVIAQTDLQADMTGLSHCQLLRYKVVLVDRRGRD